MVLDFDGGWWCLDGFLIGGCWLRLAVWWVGFAAGVGIESVLGG